MPGRRILFVHGLHPATTARELAYEFERGRPDSVYAFIEFERSRDAERAYYDLDGRPFMGGTIRIQWAKSAPRRTWRDRSPTRPPTRPMRGWSRTPPRRYSRSPVRRDDRYQGRPEYEHRPEYDRDEEYGRRENSNYDTQKDNGDQADNRRDHEATKNEDDLDNYTVDSANAVPMWPTQPEQQEQELAAPGQQRLDDIQQEEPHPEEEEQGDATGQQE